MTPADTLVLRRMTDPDVSAVWEMETETFSTPWTADTFRSLIHRAPVELLVAERNEEIVGYAVLWCIADEGELANIAIRGDLRGRGLGAELLDQVIDVARRRGVLSLYLEVRPSNAAAGRLYAGRGFEEVGVRRNYYAKPTEDARVLRLHIPTPLGRPIEETR
jgi:[ribosomal protein S18]-alanine N-acetyltransferase